MQSLSSPLSTPSCPEARTVHRARDLFRAGDARLTSAIRPIILESWRFSREKDVDPRTMKSPSVSAAAETWSRDTLMEAAAPVLDFLQNALSGRSHVVAVADAECRLIALRNTTDLNEVCEQLNIVLGAVWSEREVGTAALALSTRLQLPVQIHWYEHYADVGDRWTGNAAPIRHHADGRTVGTVSLYGYPGVAHRAALEMIGNAAATIEERLAAAHRRAHAALCDEYYRHVTRYPDDPALCIDETGVLLAATGRAASLLGWRLPDVLGQRFGELAGVSLELPRVEPSARTEASFDLPSRSGRLRFSLMPVRGERAAGYVVRLEPPARRAAHPAGSGWAALHTFESLIGESDILRSCVERCRALARSEEPVLITGETGTGKEMVAHAMHQGSDRAAGPFVALNCGGVSEDLLTAELFGYESGSFTGASRGGQLGKFEIAEGGTLFLDEVEAMSPRMQPHLLRFLEDGLLLRIGASAPRRVNVRLIAATNADLGEGVRDGTFRADLFYRLSVLEVSLPPLRDRPEDVGPLAEHFVRTKGRRNAIAPDAMHALRNHRWPGNVRELRNAIIQALEAAGPHADLTVDHLPGRIRDAVSPASGNDESRVSSFAEAEKRTIERVLADTGGNVAEAARRLQVHRGTLYRKMKDHRLRPVR
ncbi:MAG: sigma-54 dependent transcriptional regulator, acetoin dehydrogenase operon transcriptional [Candidatus Binatota bacterium]|nr:sigma-54 dependent transcriptional regulator, acetoin dehydrogenase operon transcriptional [Candidatus Binatota bacterium]